MTKKRTIDNLKLGTFVLAGLLFLIFSLYMIGRNRNLFGSTFTISASFHNINGLKPGNNVRFAGIDVGTVKEIIIVADSSIQVTMVLDRKVKKFIKQNALASIGTDGLMGNKLININAQPGFAQPLEEGSVMNSLKPIETDEMLRTLNTTNKNIEVITQNLRGVTHKLNNSSSLWNLLADTVISHDLKLAIAGIRIAGQRTALFTGEASQLMQNLKRGEGLAGTLLTDTSLAHNLRESLNEIQQASIYTRNATQDMTEVIRKVKQGDGLAGGLLYDTTLSMRLQKSMIQIEQGTTGFNENMNALKHNFLFRGYFRRQERKNKKESDH